MKVDNEDIEQVLALFDDEDRPYINIDYLIEEKIIQLVRVRHMLINAITEKLILKLENMNMVINIVKLKKYKNGNLKKWLNLYLEILLKMTIIEWS